jgi:ABC-type nitrate/sulfonate/bicarbonate transport system substrate-binding protein
MTTQADLKPVRASMMNAVHDLALLVARDEGLFSDEGLDVEIVTTPGRPRLTPSRIRGSGLQPPTSGCRAILGWSPLAPPMIRWWTTAPGSNPRRVQPVRAWP